MSAKVSTKKQPNLPLPVKQYALTAADKKRFAEEAALGMAPPGDPMLRRVAEAVRPEEITTPAIQNVITELLRAASDQRAQRQKRRKRTLVGLAAPQIGQSLRIVALDTKISADRKHTGKLEVFINPEVIWRSRETAEGREGCFSTGPVWGLVRRPVALKMRALTAAGTLTERIFEDFTARIAQHEIDHLDGIRFADRITSDQKRHWVHADELEYYIKHIKRWPRLCAKQQWEAVKNGAEF